MTNGYPGTNFLYSRANQPDTRTYRRAGMTPEDITTIYTPFGYSDWQETIKRIKAFGAAGKDDDVASTAGMRTLIFYKGLRGPEGGPSRHSNHGFFRWRARIVRSKDTTTLIGEMAT